jgi:putative ABC transport system ATP-binding protein
VNPLLEFRSITLSFQERHVLRSFALKVHQGEKVLLFGDSGTGKSSVLKLILGFVRQDSGEILIDGRSLNARRAWEVRRRAAYVPQATDLGDGTGADLLTWMKQLHANRSTALEPGEALMETLKLDSELLDKPISDLSGGERQRVAIVAAVALNRRVFLLDEATASLDAGLKSAVVALFAGRQDWTVIAVSHDPVWRDSGAFRVVAFDSNAGGANGRG